MGLEKGPKAHFGSIYGAWGALEGLQTQFSTANERKFTQMGDQAGKFCRKTGNAGNQEGKRRIFRVFLCFLFSCLVGGLGGLWGPENADLGPDGRCRAAGRRESQRVAKPEKKISPE